MEAKASGPNSSSATSWQRDREHLRFLTCGSVDDGKSTLIGRLLCDSGAVFDDQVTAVERDSRRYGTVGDDTDLALLVDGLEAEREQRITIDVAYRFFATRRRSLVVMDAPGHEQYTHNMATAASNADLAVVLVDARRGLLVQTRRHSYICALFGVRHVVLAVNKMDLAAYSQDTFGRVADQFNAFAAPLGFRSIAAIPVSARLGDNVTTRGVNTPWYDGPTLIEHLETIDVTSAAVTEPFRFSVQWVNRPTPEFRGVCGRIASGRIRSGDRIVVACSGAISRIQRIVTADGDLDEAVAGDAVTLMLSDAVDVGRGDLIAERHAGPEVSDQFAAHVLCLSGTPTMPGRSYLMRIGQKWVPASITAIKHKVDVDTLAHLAGRELAAGEIGLCNVATAAPVAFDPFDTNHATGAFILVDRDSCQTAAVGLIRFALRRATNIHREPLAVDKAARAALKHQRPRIVWFTGLSAAGKSTIARLVEHKLHAKGQHTYMLDGDNVRHGLNRDLGFTEVDRVENIRRVGEVAKLMLDAGLIVLCAFISPFRAERRMVREMVEDGEFVEIFVDSPLEECIRRDPKGLYAKARAGLIANFTGLDAPYEPPQAPELRFDTTTSSADELAEKVLNWLLTH